MQAGRRTASASGGCMRLSTLSMFAMGGWVLAGLLPGLYAQWELAQPGLQVIPLDDPGLYNLSATLHGAAFALALPLAAIALALALVSEARGLRVVHVVAIVALIASPFAFGAMTASALMMAWDVSESLRQMMPLAAIVLLAANITLAISVKAVGTPVGILVGLSMLPLAGGSYIQLILQSAGIDNVLHDTHALVAADHAYGVSILLGALAGIVAWFVRAKRLEKTMFSVVAGLAIIASGFGFVRASYALGLMGMPRRYVDYPEAFADGHWAVAMCALALSVALVAAGLWLIISRRRPSMPRNESDAGAP